METPRAAVNSPFRLVSRYHLTGYVRWDPPRTPCASMFIVDRSAQQASGRVHRNSGKRAEFFLLATVGAIQYVSADAWHTMTSTFSGARGESWSSGAGAPDASTCNPLSNMAHSQSAIAWATLFPADFRSATICGKRGSTCNSAARMCHHQSWAVRAGARRPSPLDPTSAPRGAERRCNSVPCNGRTISQQQQHCCIFIVLRTVLLILILYAAAHSQQQAQLGTLP